MTRSISAYPSNRCSIPGPAAVTTRTCWFRFFFAMLLFVTGLATTGCDTLDSNAPQDDYVGPPDAAFYSTGTSQDDDYVGPPDTVTGPDDDYVGPPDSATGQTGQDDDYVGPPDGPSDPDDDYVGPPDDRALKQGARVRSVEQRF